MAPAFTDAFLRYSAWALSSVALVSIGAVLAGRWNFGQRAAKAAVLAMLAYPIVALLMIVGSAPPEASSKATMLAKCISNAMNCTPAGIGAAIVWMVAARRKRRARSQ